MPRYYFGLNTGSRVIVDREGSELSDLDAARVQAQAVARDVMRNDGCRTLSWRVQVTDANHKLCVEVLFATAAEEMAYYPLHVQESLTHTATRVATLNDEIKSVWQSLGSLKATLSRSDGLPYLAAVDGKRIDVVGGGVSGI
jgi:hypothetical protein